MNLLETAIGWLAPPNCVSCGSEGSALCELCFAVEIIPFGTKCWRCGKLSEMSRTCPGCRRLATPRYVWISTDYENTPKKLVSIYKFGHLRAAADQLCAIMADSFLSFNTDERIQKTNYLVVPVPTATSRLRQRGFGHCELLADKIATTLGMETQNLLGRLGQGRQVGTRRADRIEQAFGSYFIKRPDKIKGRNILLIDDVITTGATLQAATAALRQAGAKHVDALVFAKRL